MGIFRCGKPYCDRAPLRSNYNNNWLCMVQTNHLLIVSWSNQLHLHMNTAQLFILAMSFVQKSSQKSKQYQMNSSSIQRNIIHVEFHLSCWMKWLHKSSNPRIMLWFRKKWITFHNRSQRKSLHTASRSGIMCHWRSSCWNASNAKSDLL